MCFLLQVGPKRKSKNKTQVRPPSNLPPTFVWDFRLNLTQFLFLGHAISGVEGALLSFSEMGKMPGHVEGASRSFSETGGALAPIGCPLCLGSLSVLVRPAKTHAMVLRVE